MYTYYVKRQDIGIFLNDYTIPKGI